MTLCHVIDDTAAKHGISCPFVRLVVAQTDGSTPREIGASMLVGKEQTYGTIGGGRLEYEAIAHARKLLKEKPDSRWLRDFRAWPLGPALGQCCGGAVRVLFERYGTEEIDNLVAQWSGAGKDGIAIRPTVSGVPVLVQSTHQDTRVGARQVPGMLDTTGCADENSKPRLTQPYKGETYFIEPAPSAHIPLFVYGAGHVGRAIVKIISDLPFEVHWVDTHQERFPDESHDHVHKIVAREPARIAAAAPVDAFHVVLTYSHAIDLEICHALLIKPDFGFLGLIGSQTKRSRFFKRLRDGGVGETALLQLHCPVGIDNINGKEPATIAIAIVAQLIAQSEKCAIRNLDRPAGEQHATVQPIRA